MPNSARYAIHQTAMALVAAVAGANAAEAVNNPALPIGLQGRAAKVLFLLGRGDDLIDQPGAREKRCARLVLGAYARTAAADLDVDALHFAARIALRGLRVALSGAGINAPIVREVQAEPELKATQADGALLLSAYEVEYIETYPA